MKGISECVSWMLKHDKQDLLSEDGTMYVCLDLDEFYVGRVVDICEVEYIKDYTIFETQEWLIRSECVEMEKALEEERKNADPEVLLCEWLNDNADQYVDGSYVRGDNLWEDMFYYMSENGIVLIKENKLEELKDKAWMYDELD